MSQQSAATRLSGFQPRVDAHCRAVVLGSFPGVASLQVGEYYAHPRNLFWSLISSAINTELTALPFAARYEALLANGIGLWDVIETCERQGSLDQAIKAEQAAQLDVLPQLAPQLEFLLLNGRKAQVGARRALSSANLDRLTLIDLPSTSPANASINKADKQQLWGAALEQVINNTVARK